MLSFDFSGCGNSEGEWVTLGWKEEKDLQAVIAYLDGLGSVSKIGLWGRSMGAATAMSFMAHYQGKIAVSVLDSAFASFGDIVNHLAE